MKKACSFTLLLLFLCLVIPAISFAGSISKKAVVPTCNNFQDYYFLNFVVEEGTTPPDGIDLELSMNTTNMNPAIYSTTTVDITLTNNGGKTANNIRVYVPVPSGFVLTGSNPYDATAGVFSTVTYNWRLNSLVIGASETITLNIFTLTEEPVAIYGQVAEADETDVDSTPANGTPNSPTEDDEAVVTFNGIPDPVLPDLIIGTITPISGRMVEQGGGFGFYIDLINQGGLLTPADYPINNAMYLSENNVFDNDDLLVQATLVSGLDQLTIGGSVPADFPTGTRYLFFAIDTDETVIESNENNNVTAPFRITVTPANPTEGIDLEVSLTQLTNQPDRYSSYSVQLAVFNNGTEPATNVRVNVPRPTGVVYTGSNPFTLSFGQFSTFTDILTVPQIDPGVTSQLTLHYYLLAPEAPVVYAQVIQADGNDVDSTPNNGTPPVPNEDDEASTSDDNPPIDLPDLTATDLETPMTIELESPVSISYQLQNIGNITASGSFDIYYYFSADNILNIGDQPIGQRTFADFPAGGFSDELDEFILLSSSGIAPGPGFIIVSIDNGNSILESNENNNVITIPITVIPAEPAPACTEDLGTEALACLTAIPEVELFQVVNNQLQIYQEGVLFEEKTIPAVIVNNYVKIVQGVRFNNGFMLFAYQNDFVDNNNVRNLENLTAILTDVNLEPLMDAVIVTEPTWEQASFISDARQINDNQVAIISRTSDNYGAFIDNHLLVINESLELLSTSLLVEGPNANASIRITNCGNYKISVFNNPSCGAGCNITSVFYGDFIDGEFHFDPYFNNNTVLSMVNLGFGTKEYNWALLRTTAGGFIRATTTVQVPQSLPAEYQVTFTKTLNGDTIYSKLVTFSDIGGGIIDINGIAYFFTQGPNGDNNLFYDIECLIDETPTPVGVDLELSSELTVSAPGIFTKYSVIYTLINNGDEAATDIEVDFVLPEGTVYVGSNPFMVSAGAMSPYNNLFTLDELAAGQTAVIQLNYFLRSDLPQNHYAQVGACNETDSDSTPGNGTPNTPTEDDETAVSTEASASTNSVANSNTSSDHQGLNLLKVFPNPTMSDDVHLILESPKTEERMLEVFNSMGQMVIRTSISLGVGYNNILLEVQQLPSGMYRVIIPGEQTRFVNGIFMVTK